MCASIELIIVKEHKLGEGTLIINVYVNSHDIIIKVSNTNF